MEIRSIGQFLEYWDTLRGRTRRVVTCIPPELLESTHRAGAFTLGDLVRHLATIERYMYAETVSGRPSRYPGCGRTLADGYAAVLAYFDRLDSEARAIIGALGDADVERKCQTPAGTAITTWKWLRAMCEHEAHHRGQIYLMLNMLEVATRSRHFEPLLLLACVTIAACASARLPNPNGAAFDQAGWAVAIDGNWAIVGVPRSDTIGSNAGKALIYHRSGNSWPLQAAITSTTPVTNADFGWSVDISGDRVVVGAFGDVTTNFISGAAYIFERSGEVWTQAARLAVDTIGESGFGSAVAISGDYAVVGAPYPPPPTFTGPGLAWVYRRNAGNGQWNLDALLEASDAIDFIEFGTAVDIDGDVVVVGAKKGVVGKTIGGAAYVFRRQGSNWNEEAKLVASDPAYHDFFGSAVAISGNRIVVGAKEEDAKGDAAGAAYVFVGDTTSGEWTESQKLTADDGDDGHNFGYSVSIDDGRILIGAWLADGSVNTTGAAYHFHTEGNAWVQERKLILSNGEYGDGYGNSVSISGPCGIVGAVNRDINDVEKVGAAYRYCNLPGPIPAEVELDIICCFQPPDPAGPVIVTTRIVNAGEGRVIGRRWIESVAPDGTAEVVVGPDAITLGAGEAREERHVFRRPGGPGAALPVLRLRWEDRNGIRTVQARNQSTRG